MKQLASIVVTALILSSSSLLIPTQAQAHGNFLVNLGRMATVVPTFIVRQGGFLVEGAMDGLIEGLTSRKGFLHGENRYINSTK